MSKAKTLLTYPSRLTSHLCRQSLHGNATLFSALVIILIVDRRLLVISSISYTDKIKIRFYTLSFKLSYTYAHSVDQLTTLIAIPF